ncbi:GNAT family N-acetyltransferase [Leptolyngbya sp. FACHB-541]|uniref:GNAT family N-acetyltransferase n=1 Tax=Leptolyngbya sp. FACHB-541 TaxID=2692810 RepID=UPI0016843DF8|nr:GNAT family N-acetyltransferase [Leptolyngbya sp. FACHB-541]MBD1995970.1 GNAT family N-acetyltransferase [Leptolyngbya sp. FACHB-541]
MVQEWHREEYTISTDRQRLDLQEIHNFLANHSYWAIGRSFEAVKKSIDHSLPFGIYRDTQLVGFARVLTDYVTFAYLADVFVVESFRGNGLGQWLVEVILAHPELQSLRRWLLVTHTAQPFYRKLGFTELEHPEQHLEKPVLKTDIRLP